MCIGESLSRWSSSWPVFPRLQRSLRHIQPSQCAYLSGLRPEALPNTMSRILASKLTEAWSMAVQVENRPGAGGSIAAGIAAKAPADGYTLMSCDVATHAIDTAIYGNLPYDPLKDFVAIAHIGSAPNVLVVGASVEIRSLD